MLNTSYVIGYEKAYLAKETYQEKAPVMQLDPNHVCKAEATIVVIASDRQQSCDMTKVYKVIVESSELIAKVADDAGIDTLGVSELLYLGRIAGLNIRETGAFNVWDEESDTFRITAVHDEEAKCRAMLDSAVAFIMEKQPDIADALGEYEVSVVNESFGIISDMEIANLQKAVLNDTQGVRKD